MVILRLSNQASRDAARRAIDEAPPGYVVRLTKPEKSRGQESKYHAMIDDIAEQYPFCGRFWDAEDMKRLLIDQFRRDTEHMDEFRELWKEVTRIQLAPSLDGSGTVALGVQSRKFPKELATGFIEWLEAFGAQNGVKYGIANF